MMAAEPVIAIRGLTNRFGKTVVHEDLSLDVMRGEVLGVVGALPVVFLLVELRVWDLLQDGVLDHFLGEDLL